MNKHLYKLLDKPHFIALLLVVITTVCFFDYLLQNKKVELIEFEVAQIQDRLVRHQDSARIAYNALNEQYGKLQTQPKRWVVGRYSKLLQKIEAINLQIIAADRFRSTPNNFQQQPINPIAAPPAFDLAPPPPSIVRRSEGVIRGNTIRQVKPDYPQLARTANITGDVVVEITIGEDGYIESARVIAGHPLLQQAALVAAKKWEFNQTLLNGIPVKVSGVLTFRFKL